MKNASIVFNAVLAVAVVVLFVLHFTGGKAKNHASDGSTIGDNASEFPVVYINTDSLLLKYDFAKFINEQLMKKEENSRTNFNEQAKVFQQDATEFQRKVQNNGFISLDRARKEEQRLAQRERELQELNNRLSNELMMEQSRVNKQLRDTLVLFLEEIQPKRNFKVVLSNTMGDNVLYSQKGQDITNEVVTALNARYNASKNTK
jgi:outer membrane protein